MLEEWQWRYNKILWLHCCWYLWYRSRLQDRQSVKQPTFPRKKNSNHAFALALCSQIRTAFPMTEPVFSCSSWPGVVHMQNIFPVWRATGWVLFAVFVYQPWPHLLKIPNRLVAFLTSLKTKAHLLLWAQRVWSPYGLCPGDQQGSLN